MTEVWRICRLQTIEREHGDQLILLHQPGEWFFSHSDAVAALEKKVVGHPLARYVILRHYEAS